MAVAVRAPELRITAADGSVIGDLEAIQGLWSAEQYFRLTETTHRLMEFTHGRIEVLPSPTDNHQAILGILLQVLHALLQPLGGVVSMSGLKLQIGPDRFREPDLLALLDAADPRRQNAYWLGADLVMEVVSADNPERDTRVKRAEYAEAGIPEYWIVDPAAATITVLRLAGKRYATHGVFRRGETATSALLPGFAVAVDAVLDAQ